MINTSAYESYTRWKKLKDAIYDIQNSGTHHPFHWMLEYLIAGLNREVEFMRQSKERWCDMELYQEMGI